MPNAAADVLSYCIAATVLRGEPVAEEAVELGVTVTVPHHEVTPILPWWDLVGCRSAVPESAAG
eukprot:11155860-Lingulodinium_polyedra.AAC.1